MNNQELQKSLSFILYNLCYHHKDGNPPLSNHEIDRLLSDGEDNKTRRNTYCKCLIWAKDNPSANYQDIMLENRSYTNEYIYSYLMKMYEQIEDANIFEKYELENSH